MSCRHDLSNRHLLDAVSYSRARPTTAYIRAPLEQFVAIVDTVISTRRTGIHYLLLWPRLATINRGMVPP